MEGEEGGLFSVSCSSDGGGSGGGSDGGSDGGSGECGECLQTRVRFIVDKRGGCCKVEVFLFGVLLWAARDHTALDDAALRLND